LPSIRYTFALFENGTAGNGEATGDAGAGKTKVGLAQIDKA
jgi:hypothetical protein